MIDDDNQPAPENLPSTEDSTGATDNIMGLWTHSGISSGKQQSNAMPSQNLPSGCRHCPTHQTSTCSKGCFSHPLSKQQSFPKPTKTFPMARNQSYAEFLCWIGLWMLMGTIVSPQRREFWATSPIDAFHGAPLHLGVWMTRTRFEAILSTLTFTDIASPTFIDKFLEVWQMVEAWGMNMKDNFLPGYMNCLDEKA